MKKLLFIVPMHIEFESFINPAANTRSFKKADGKVYNSLSTDLPLGPLSMSAYIKKHMDIEVKLIDFNVEINLMSEFKYDSFFDACLDTLKSLDFTPDYVGVSSLFSPSFFNFLDCAKVAKQLYPSAWVVGGGNIPTNSHKYIYTDLQNTDFDALCYGEGEKPLLGLLQAENPAEFLAGNSSWITKAKLEKSDTLFVPQHDFIEDLDEIPFFDYDLCSMEKHGLNPVTSSFHNIESTMGFHIMTSRGCPYFCTFCAANKVHGRNMRYHSIERVRADLTRLHDEYGARMVVFQDDHLMGDKDRVYKILEIVTELKLGSLFQNGLTLYALDRPMLEAFYAAGVRHLVLPVESGSEKVLKEQMKKPLKLRISEQVSRDCRELGIYTNTNILIGMPGETKQDIEDARRNLRRVQTNWFNIACASPLVGSEMHDIAMKKNYISADTMGSDYHKALIKTEDFTPEYIQDMQYLMNLELNFVYNNDIKFGQYEVALKGMNNVIRLKPDHAFAHYFAAKCYAGLNDQKSYEHHHAKYLEYSKQPFWQKYVEYFNLTDDIRSTLEDVALSA